MRAALLVILAGFLLLPTPALAQPTVFLPGDVPLVSTTILPTPQPLPVLFVHGHRASTETDTEHYKTTWQRDRGTLKSFDAALTQNGGLGIEAYYMHFLDQDRSIVADAKEIGEAVELILKRHDSAYAADPQRGTNVQVVLIAFSKGTISSRVYLKSLVDTTYASEHGFPAPRVGFRPVSEFIALAPPNHGTRWPLPTSSLSVQQLNNGYSGLACLRYTGGPGENFIQSLNGHDIGDTHALAPSPLGPYDSEAPGSREDGRPPHEGVLYVAIYADGDRDPVGGDTPQDDCTTSGGVRQGRKLARNLATHAQNRPVSTADLPGTDGIEVHQDTPHTFAVMCLALYTAVYHRTPTAANPCTVGNDVPIVPLPPRATVALVLDLSGSMLSPACPGCASSRLLVLRQSAELFVQLWSLVGAPQDAIGVNYFRTDITPAVTTFAPLGASAATIITDLGNLSTTASSWTAMGGGLQSAITALRAETSLRHVVLFTDGMQNVFPKVQPTSLEISGTGPPQSNVTASSPITVLNMGLGIRVSVIGIGAGETFQGLLRDIATATDGKATFTIAPNEDLRRFFIEELINVLRGFSPQLVGYRRGTLAAATARESFAINANVRKLVLKLSWQAPKKLTFRVERNGVDVTRLGTIVDGPFYRFVAFDPARVPAVRAGGTWTIRVQGAAGDAYEAAAVVDEPSLRVDPSLGPRAYRVGDALELEMRLRADGKALSGATVQATVLVPQKSVGTLLATTPARDDGKTGYTEPGLTATQRRIEALLLDKKTHAALRPVAHRVALTDRGAGVYRASFKGVTVPGIYTVVFDAAGERTAVGTLRRTETRSTLVRFGAAEASASGLAVQAVADTAAHSEVVVRVRPRDRHGNYLGPGEAGAIRVALSEGTVAKEVTDLGDGGYAVPILISRRADPTVTVTVAGVPLYRGALSALPRVRAPR